MFRQLQVTTDQSHSICHHVTRKHVLGDMENHPRIRQIAFLAHLVHGFAPLKIASEPLFFRAQAAILFDDKT